MPERDVQKIGKYDIQAELGQGGFGRVYRAFDPTVGRPVAIKILTTEGNPDLLSRFRTEATAAGNLSHKNIVTIYEFGEHNGQPFLVMEFLEGEDLTQIINSGRQLTLLEKMNIMDQVADGLESAHRSGVVHRDVKPANIRLLPDGTVKIMDFGIARVKRDRDATRLTQQGDLIGTILYMSPEQFGGSEADALCDIFAYGVTYFELLTGKHPFRSADPRVVMFKITMEDLESVRTLAPDCPEGLEQILNRALQKDRELRYQSLGDLRADAAPLKFELEQDRARQLVANALQLPGGTGALVLVHEALNLDPSNREARQLRENLQRQIQKEALSPRIEAMLQSAQKHIESRSFAQAVQMLESALKLDQTNDRVRESLEMARAEMQRSKDAARLVAAALADVKLGDWLGASEKGYQAARLDPSNTEATRVLARVDKHIQAVLSKVDDLIAQGDLDSAIRELKDLAALRPESKEIERRLAEATASKLARDRIHGVLQRAKQCIDQSQLSDAIESLTAALNDFPDEPNLLALRARAEDALFALKRSETIEKAVRSAESLLRATRFDEALHEIQSALESYPDDDRLAKLRAKTQAAKVARDRDLLIQRTANECNRFRADNRFAEALEAVQAGLRECGEELVLVELQRRVQEEWERHQRAEAVGQRTEEGRRLLEQGRPEQALQVLRKASEQYPEEEELKRLLAQAQEQVRAQQRREAVEKAAVQAEARAEQQDFEGAIGILEKALKSWPQESRRWWSCSGGCGRNGNANSGPRQWARGPRKVVGCWSKAGLSRPWRCCKKPLSSMRMKSS